MAAFILIPYEVYACSPQVTHAAKRFFVIKREKIVFFEGFKTKSRIFQRYTGLMAEAHPLSTCTGFDWDEGNVHKNWAAHQVTPEEAEDIFFNEPLIAASDLHHSKQEKRYYALGQTSVGRRLFVSFTVRQSLVPIISARNMNRKENEKYANHEKNANT